VTSSGGRCTRRDIVGRALHKLHQPTQVVTGLLTAANFRILVADDEPDNVSLLATRLEHEGYLHLQARDGQETLDKLRSEQPDLLLLDVNMPVKSGFEVLAEMRSDPAISHIPVIQPHPRDRDHGRADDCTRRA